MGKGMKFIALALLLTFGLGFWGAASAKTVACPSVEAVQDAGLNKYNVWVGYQGWSYSSNHYTTDAGGLRWQTTVSHLPLLTTHSFEYANKVLRNITLMGRTSPYAP